MGLFPMSRQNSELDGSRWRGWLVPGVALLLAAGLLIVVTWPRSGPTPSTAPSPATTQPSDDHAVATDQGIVSFRFEGDAIVVRLTGAERTTELGRATVTAVATAAPGGTASPMGTAVFAMLCGPADGPDSRRYVFGHTDAGSSVAYSGPQAVGQGAADGLFLFALLPGPVDSTATIEVRAGPRGPGGGFQASVFSQAASEGQGQPSGCYVVE